MYTAVVADPDGSDHVTRVRVLPPSGFKDVKPKNEWTLGRIRLPRPAIPPPSAAQLPPKKRRTHVFTLYRRKNNKAMQTVRGRSLRNFSTIDLAQLQASTSSAGTRQRENLGKGATIEEYKQWLEDPTSEVGRDIDQKLRQGHVSLYKKQIASGELPKKLEKARIVWSTFTDFLQHHPMRQVPTYEPLVAADPKNADKIRTAVKEFSDALVTYDNILATIAARGVSSKLAKKMWQSNIAVLRKLQYPGGVGMVRYPKTVNDIFDTSIIPTNWTSTATGFILQIEKDVGADPPTPRQLTIYKVGEQHPDAGRPKTPTPPSTPPQRGRSPGGRSPPPTLESPSGARPLPITREPPGWGGGPDWPVYGGDLMNREGRIPHMQADIDAMFAKYPTITRATALQQAVVGPAAGDGLMPDIMQMYQWLEKIATRAGEGNNIPRDKVGYTSPNDVTQVAGGWFLESCWMWFLTPHPDLDYNWLRREAQLHHDGNLLETMLFAFYYEETTLTMAGKTENRPIPHTKAETMLRIMCLYMSIPPQRKRFIRMYLVLARHGQLAGANQDFIQLRDRLFTFFHEKIQQIKSMGDLDYIVLTVNDNTVFPWE